MAMRFTASILVMTRREVTFETESPIDGVIAYPRERLTELMGDAGTESYAIVHLTVAEPDARLSTFTCVYCHKDALKEHWGPGRITCPHCGRRAPAASETP
jgi:hypothetical protein